jgi:hypothetical protein
MDIPAEVLLNNPSISRLAEAILQRGLVARAASGFSVASLIRAFMDLQATRQVVDPRQGRPPNPVRNPGRMVIVLAGPRSGSTLTQLVLNMHSQLYAGQELYLLQFFTMLERAQRLSSPELSSWVFEGLRKTVMELRQCTLEQADALLEEMSDFSTQDVYSVLQAWCGNRVLVDKTPPYVWSLDTLRRAETLFEEVQYIHVHRHPYANISSMAAEAINRDFLAGSAGAVPADWAEKVRRVRGFRASCLHARLTHPYRTAAQLDDALWTESETLWAQGNANVMDFFKDLPPARCMRLAYEDLLRTPDAAVRQMCAFLRLPFEAAMCQPYTADNLSTFEPAAAGGLGAGDPKLRQNSRIDAAMADSWHGVTVPRPLGAFAAHVARELGYAIPAWKEPALRADAPAELQRLNSVTAGVPLVLVHGLSGTLTRLEPLAAALAVPVFGLRMTAAAQALHSMDALAAAYVAALASLGLPPTVFLGAADDFGARLAHAMLRLWVAARGQSQAAAPRVASLILLDGCLAGPLDSSLPPPERALWELAQEAAARSCQLTPPLAAFLASARACANEDEQLAMMAEAYRPPDMPLPEWDLLAVRLVKCVLRNTRQAEPSAGGHGSCALQLCSEAGRALRTPARNARVWAGELRTEHLAGLPDLLGPAAAQRVAEALLLHMRALTKGRKR